MKQIMAPLLLTAGALAVLSACALPESLSAPAPEAEIAPANLEQAKDAEQVQQVQEVQAQSPGNTYNSTCGPLSERFATKQHPPNFAERLAIVEARGRVTTPKVTVFPVPDEAKNWPSSGVCRIISDIDANGVPQNVMASCLPVVFEPIARGAFLNARFESGPFENYSTPMEFCRSDQ